MIKLPTNDAEKHRVDMVRSFGLLDQARPLQHDEIAALARNLAKTEWGLVSLVDSERQWFSGMAKFVDVGGCRWSSFCTHVVAEPEALLWVEDARTDFRFANLPSVLEAPNLRFYAGAPILVNGYAVGSCACSTLNPELTIRSCPPSYAVLPRSLLKTLRHVIARKRCRSRCWLPPTP